jgi:hypothetical protein
MMAGDPPSKQERWLKARSDRLRKVWRQKFSTMLTEAEVEQMVDNVMLRIVEKIADLEASGIGQA